jgi:hypothetical protein
MDKVSYETLETMIREAKGRALGSKWKHYKGGIYVISDIAIMEATNEVAVIYCPIERPNVKFVRPISVWSELVEWKERQVPRFSKLDYNV